jgi:hypothetical protein
MTEDDLKKSPNTMQLTFVVAPDGEMTISKGWFFTEDFPDDVMERCQMMLDGILLAVEMEPDEFVKKALYGIMWSSMKDQEQEMRDAEAAPSGENIVSLARRKMN